MFVIKIKILKKKREIRFNLKILKTQMYSKNTTYL